MVGTELLLILQVEKEIDTEVHLFLQGENNEKLQWSWRSTVVIPGAADSTRWYTYNLNALDRETIDLTRLATTYY